MAVVSVYKLWTGRGATDTHLNHRTYREVFEVLVDDPLTLPEIIANTAGIPQVGTTLATDPGAVMVDFDMEQSEENPCRWLLTAKYDSKPELPDSLSPDGGSTLSPSEIPENPLLRPAVWSINFQKTTEVGDKWYRVDDAGAVANALTAVRNSAKLPFDPPLTIEVSRPVIHVVKNVRPDVATLAFFLSLQDAVNKDPWKGLGRRVARIDGASGDGKFENGVAFVEVKIEIALKWDTWDARPLDCGYAELTRRDDPVTQVQFDAWTKIRDPFGQDATEPVPLDGNGRKLAPGADPVFLRGVPKNYRLANFTQLLGI
jgi:hypothetical protein